MYSAQTHQHMFQYKVNKIVRLIKKIRQTLYDEGLDHRQLPQLIKHSLDINHERNPHELSSPSLFQESTFTSLFQNSSKFTVSALLNLSETYQNLLNSLEDQSPFLDLKKISSSKQTKQSPVKIEETYPPIDIKKERSAVVKLEEEAYPESINTFSQSENDIQNLKKELAEKRRELKQLREEYEARKRTEYRLAKPSKKEKKSKRK